MKFTYDPAKERKNLATRKLSLRLTEFIFEDPFVLIIYDRFDRQHRYHAIGVVGGKCLLAVFTNPDPDDETWVHTISLREATPDERRRFEEGDED